MEYSFTDWDRREYKRESDNNISVASEPNGANSITLTLSDSKKEFIKFNLTTKEAKAISLSLDAAINQLVTKMEINEIQGNK
jgi:hypothetical protein